MASFFGSKVSAKGVSVIDFPAYLFSIGFGSKLSIWLTPPFMNNQITFLALGAKCGRPVGGDQVVKFPRPSWCNLTSSAKPANPKPTFDKKARRDELPFD